MNNRQINELNEHIKDYIKYVCEDEEYDNPSDLLLTAFLGEFFSIGDLTLPLFEEQHHCLIRFLYVSSCYFTISSTTTKIMNDYINNTNQNGKFDEEFEPFENDTDEWTLIRRYAWCYVYNMTEKELDRCVL